MNVILIISVTLVAIGLNGSSFSCSALEENNDGNGQNQSIDFTGKYRLIKSENFDAFLYELGVGYFKRSIANRVKPEYEIMKNGDIYTIKTITPFSTSEISFKLNGEIFEENRLDGVRVKSNVIRSGNKWIQKQFGDKEVTIIREFNGDTIKVTATVNNVSSIRIYERIK